MKLIKLTRGKFAKVDDQDYERLNKYKWHAREGQRKYYAARKVRKSDSNYKYRATIYMHSMILDCPDEYEIDHINSDGLDNQKSNLRICNKSQNQANKRIGRNNISGYKGVYYDKRSNKWIVIIQKNYKRIQLGLFKDKIKAAKAYNKKAKELFGEFAHLNIIRSN